MFDTDVGKSVWSAPDSPPKTYLSCRTWASSLRLSLTVWSVNLMDVVGIFPDGGVVRGHQVSGGAVEFFQRSLDGQVVQQARLRQNGDIRRAVGRDPRAEHGADLVAGRREGRGRARVVRELLQDRLEILLLVLRPDGGHLDFLAGERLARGCRRRPARRQQRSEDRD